MRAVAVDPGGEFPDCVTHLAVVERTRRGEVDDVGGAALGVVEGGVMDLHIGRRLITTRR